MEKSNRCKRATDYQKDYLVNYLEHNEDIANDKFTTADGARLRDSKWELLALTLNSLGGPQKDGSKWRKYWRDLRFNTKAKYGAIRAAKMRQASNGFRRTKALTLLEEKIIHITDQVDVEYNAAEVGFGDDTFLIYDDCGGEASNEYFFEEVKCEITETAATDLLETTTNEAMIAAEIKTAPATLSENSTVAATKTADIRVKSTESLLHESKDQVEKFSSLEERKLKAMELANDLKKEQLELMRVQTEAIRADTEMKSYFCTKLVEAIVACRGERTEINSYNGL